MGTTFSQDSNVMDYLDETGQEEDFEVCVVFVARQ
jgi:hypothetical protein